MRRDLIRRGVDPHIVSATPTARLNRLDRMTPETPVLVIDVDDDHTLIEDTCPNLAFRPFVTEGVVDEDVESWDEWEATRYAAAAMRAERDGRQDRPALRLVGLGADERTPWDELDPIAHALPGGDAA